LSELAFDMSQRMNFSNSSGIGVGVCGGNMKNHLLSSKNT
jgi:hypothetical protein